MKRIVMLASLLTVMGLFMSTSTIAQLWNSNVNDIYNTNSGNVGIGTTTPAGKLHIYNSSDAANVWIESPYSGSANHVIGAFIIKNNTSGDMYYNGLRTWEGGQRELVLSAYDAASGTWSEFINFNLGTKKWEIRGGVGLTEFKNSDNVLFNNTGGVGIGVTSLGTGVKFQVAGKIKCQEVEVAITPWPDHVFNSNYNLKPLGEVESFILQNKHLPDVPNEQEVQANGVDLGKLNATMLQKIEELTLYVIQLKKENDQLTERVKKLEH